jgi:hypothetical protein
MSIETDVQSTGVAERYIEGSEFVEKSEAVVAPVEVREKVLAVAPL